MNQYDFVKMIETYDIKIFEGVYSQTTLDDRKTLLNIQNIIRDAGKYVYLEIGSYQGGTIQPHYVDPKCTQIISIDRRPPITPDERGETYDYDGVTNQDMLNNLKSTFPNISKDLICFDCDASDVDISKIKNKPRLMFIDGEHTNKAVLNDFRFCLEVGTLDSIILFHDTHYIFGGIDKIKSLLNNQRLKYRYFKVGGSVSAILMNNAVDEYINNLKSISIDEKEYLKEAKSKLWKTRLSNKFPAIYELLRAINHVISK